MNQHQKPASNKNSHSKLIKTIACIAVILIAIIVVGELFPEPESQKTDLFN